MYHNLINQNPLLNQFNTYMSKNPNSIPFQNNHLINNNPHVINNLNDLIQQNRNIQQKIPIYQQQLNNSSDNQNIKKGQMNRLTTNNSNIIEEMLKPQKIVKDNKDVESNYKVRKDIQERTKVKPDVEITNTPYKPIIRDKIVTKNPKDVTRDDFVVHKSIRQIDADIVKFNQDLRKKEAEKDKINDELKMEFHIDNYDKHKRKFEIKETFIKNLAFKANTFDENKQDYIEFYKNKQKEAEEGKKLCDQILHNIVDEGIISKDELPTDDLNLSQVIASTNTSNSIINNSS